MQDEERLVSCFKAALAAGGRRLKLVVVDHVVSFPPVIMPVQQICAMCRWVVGRHSFLAAACMLEST